MTRDELAQQLTELGLTRNQALAWITLLQDDGEDGLTGYELAARSGIPRSAVYKVVQQLVTAGAAFAVGTDPKRFLAASPNEWLKREQTRVESQFTRVAEAMESLPRPSRPEPVWVVRTYDAVLARIEAMLLEAQESVYLHLWPREVERLRPTLERIASRPLHRVLHAPAPIEPVLDGFSSWTDVLDDEAKAAWSHKALVVVDHSQALIGGAEPGLANDAVWTQNPSLVDVATNHIILDITLLARRRGEDPFPDVAPMMRPHLPGE